MNTFNHSDNPSDRETPPGRTLHLPPDDLPTGRQRSKIPTYLAWLVILAVAGGMFALNNFVTVNIDVDEDAPTNEVEAEPAEDAVGLAMMKLQARLLVGQYQMAGDPTGDLLESADSTLNTGTIDQRLRFVTVAGEIGGSDAALNSLVDLEKRIDEAPRSNDDQRIELSETQAEIASVLRQIYQEYQQEDFTLSAISEVDQQFLLEELGWFGELALAPAADPDDDLRSAAIWPAMRTFYVMMAAAGLGMITGFLGFIGLVLVIIIACMRKLRSRLGPAIRHGGIYAETFAVWLLLFIGLSAFGGTLFAMPEDWELLSSAIPFFLSLLALLWPRLRGVSFKEIRYDIGLRFSEQPFMDILYGFAGYAMTLPLLGVGLLLTLFFMYLQGLFGGIPGEGVDSFDPTGGPAHPIIQHVANPTIIGMFQVYLIASIAAPIVEEIMFRGVLYKHLRNGTHNWGFFFSVAFSCLLNGTLFAMIHPQGWIAIPVLCSLAIGMSLLREWRGSIIPSMILHALSNGLVMTMLLLAMS